MNKVKKIGFSCCIFIFLIGSNTTVQATTSYATNVEYLVDETGAEKKDVEKVISRYAKYKDMSKEEIVLELTNEFKKIEMNNRYPQEIKRKEPLMQGATGDLYYTSKSTIGYEHGHIGMYCSPEYVIEAPGPNKPVRYVHRSDVAVVDNETYIQRVVGVTPEQKANAVEWAKSKVGTPYDVRPLITRNGDYSKLNCSELVWAAYNETAHIDLDSNRGLGVYPKDIATNLQYVQTYATQ